MRSRVVMLRRCAIIILAIAAISAEEVPREAVCRVFFTRPGRDAHAPAAEGTPERAIIHLIGRSRESFFGAFYDIRSPEVAAALIAARGRGVDVRLVTERDNMGSPEIAMIIAAGIPVVADRGRGFMHNKFAIVDGEYVWTGSYNITPRGGRTNNNNAILIRSPGLAELFREEFEEMFEHRLFGGGIRSLRSVFGARGVEVEGVRIEAFFSPEDAVRDEIVQLIRRARHSVCFMAFTFTSAEIAEAMAQARARGVAVAGVVEGYGAMAGYSRYVLLQAAGCAVRRDRGETTMHHKVIIIDGEIVVTGSYNFTANAGLINDENLLVIRSARVAAEYLAEFARLYGAAGP